jgi:RsiW-degrading membrane proteinase PrsW (M82 family)
MIESRKEHETYENWARSMLNIFILLAFILAMGYNTYVKTTFSLVVVLVIAAIGIIYRIYSAKKQKDKLN